MMMIKFSEAEFICDVLLLAVLLKALRWLEGCAFGEFYELKDLTVI